MSEIKALPKEKSIFKHWKFSIRVGIVPFFAFFVFFIFTPQAFASLINFTGFELGVGGASSGITEHGGTSGGTAPTFVTSPVKSGTYAVRINPATTSTSNAEIHNISTDGRMSGQFSVATIYAQFQFRVATLPATASEEIAIFLDTALVRKASIRINSAGNLLIYDQTNTLVATGSTALSLNTWYSIKYTGGTGTTASYTLYLNDVSELTGTMDTNATNYGRFNLGKFSNSNSQTIDVFYDDAVVDSQRFHGTVAQPASIVMAKPIANGSTMQWTAGTGASNYLEVDETPPDTTTYIKSTGVAGDTALFTFQTMSTLGISGAQPIGVKVGSVTSEDTTVTSGTLITVKSGASTSNTSAYDGSTTQLGKCVIKENDFNLSTAWNETTVDALEAGVKENNAVAVRATFIYKQILYLPQDTNLPSIGAAASARGGAVTTISATHVLSGNPNRKVVILSVITGTSDKAINAPTYNGSAVTQIGADLVAGSTSVWTRMRMDYVDEASLPVAGSYTATVTAPVASGALAIHVLELYNAAQGAPDASNSNTTTASVSTLSVTLTTILANTLIFTGSSNGDPRTWDRNSVEGQYPQTYFDGTGGPSITTLERAVAFGANVQTANLTSAGNRMAIFSASFAKAPTTTLGDGTNGSNSTIGPGAAATEIDRFSLVTSAGTDTVTGMTVTLGPASAFNNIASVDVQTTAGVSKCSSSSISSNTVTLTSCAISVTTTSTEYKVMITPKSHANMPAVPGASYASTATVTAITATITTTPTGTDTASATITVDNASPAGVTASTGTAGSTVVNLAWTNPADSDFTIGGTVVVLRRATTAVADVPVEGTTYIVGNIIGTATVACVVTGSPPATSCQDTGLTNGTAYHYKIFTQDSRGNYDAGTVPTGSPVTPVASTVISGTTNLGDLVNVIKVAINGILDSATGSISAGTWSITPATAPTTGQVVVVFVNGQADSSESTAVAKYDGTGDMTGIVLNSNVLSIGSVDNQSLTLANLDLYDCANDEDVMYRVNANILEVQGLSTCEGTVSNSYVDPTIQIESGDTLTIASTETLSSDNITITGTLTQTTTGVITATGNLSSSGTFNGGSGAITVVGFSIPSGTFTNTSGSLTISGDITISSGATFTKGSGTVTLKKGSAQTLTDSNTTKQDLGIIVVAVNGTNTTLSLATSTKMTSLTINASQTFSTGANTLTLTGSGTAASRPLINNGTFTQSTGTVEFIGTSATEISDLTSDTIIYNNLSLIPAGTVTYTLGTASLQTLQVNGTLTIGNGSNVLTATAATYNPALDLRGDLTIAASAVYTKGSGTTTLRKGAVQTITDSTTSKQDLGAVAVTAYPAAGAALVQSRTNYPGGNATSRVLAYTSNNAAGNLLIVVTSWADTTVSLPTIGDTAGNTWVALAKAVGTDAAKSAIKIFYAANSVAGANTVTVTYNATAVDPGISIYEYSGIATTNPLDVSASKVGSLNTTTPTTDNFVTSFTDLIFVGLAEEAIVQSSISAGTNYTKRETNLNHADSQEDRFQASAGTHTASFTLGNTTSSWTIGVAAFKEAAGANTTVNLGSSVKFTSLSVAASQTFSTGANTLTLTGSGTAGSRPLINSGTFTQSTGTVEYVGSSATDISNLTSDTITYNNLTLDPAATVTYTLGTASAQTLTVNGTLTIGNGTNVLTATAATYSPTMNLNGNATIAASSVFIAPSNLTIAANLTNNGTFTHNSGTVTVAPSGSSSTIDGSANTTFNNLTVTSGAGAGKSLLFKNGNTYTFAGTFNVAGTAGNPLVISSTTSGSQWLTTFNSTITLSYIAVKDSGCSGGGSASQNSTVTNRGNNGSCWGFVFYGGGGSSGGTPPADGQGSGGGTPVGGGTGLGSGGAPAP